MKWTRDPSVVTQATYFPPAALTPSTTVVYPTVKSQTPAIIKRPFTRVPPKSTTLRTLITPEIAACKDSSVKYFSHKNCRKYWWCLNGEAFEVQCPARTSWDSSSNVCKASQTATCP